jgi:hypothetical protein
VGRLNELKTDIVVSVTSSNSCKPTHRVQNAPGKISTTANGWTTDNTKGSFLGMTAHWIDVKDGSWKLRAEVVGFQPITGEHSGRNLGRYFVGLCDHMGIMNKQGSKVIVD